jgi:hypothetical protein
MVRRQRHALKAKSQPIAIARFSGKRLAPAGSAGYDPGMRKARRKQRLENLSNPDTERGKE